MIDFYITRFSIMIHPDIRLIKTSKRKRKGRQLSYENNRNEARDETTADSCLDRNYFFIIEIMTYSYKFCKYKS